MNNQEKQPFHFYASSIGEWRVKDDLEELIKTMKISRLNFNLWKVPGPANAEYKIEQYAPVVKGRVYLGTYQLLGQKGNKWQMYCQEFRND